MFKFLALLIVCGISNCLFANNTENIQLHHTTNPVNLKSDTVPLITHDTIPEIVALPVDTLLRMSNLSPYITLAADSILHYQPILIPNYFGIHLCSTIPKVITLI